MKFTLALFAAANAEVQSKPDVPNPFAEQRDNLREHINYTLNQWYGECESFDRWSDKLNNMVDRLDKAFNKCGEEYTSWNRKRRQAEEEGEIEERLSKKNEAKATSQIRSVTKRIVGRNLGGCTRNRMLARAERIVGQMVDAKTSGSC